MCLERSEALKLSRSWYFRSVGELFGRIPRARRLRGEMGTDFTRIGISSVGFQYLRLCRHAEASL
ncbi:MAG: hypothetical protein QXK99_07340, partial [Candidatus Korarchaeum sp.]